MSDKLKEIALKAGRGAIGEVPFVGSLMTEFITTPKEHRLETCLTALEKLFTRIEADYNITSGTLAKRDDFLDILYGSISLWLVNSDPKKLEAILALLENVAVNPSLDGAKETIVLRLLRDLSGSHLYLVSRFGEDSEFNFSNEFNEMLGVDRWNSDWGIVHNDLSQLGVIEPGGLSALGHTFLERITPTSI